MAEPEPRDLSKPDISPESSPETIARGYSSDEGITFSGEDYYDWDWQIPPETSFFDHIMRYWAEHELVKKVKQHASQRLDKLAHHGKSIKQKLTQNAKPVGEKLGKTLKLKEMRQMMKDTPFLRTKDKISFMLGILLVMASEFYILKWPTSFHMLYTCCLFPLLVLRFMMYHKAKWHYFMLDFCYFCQIVTLFSVYIYPANTNLFKLTFSLANGPLLVAVVAWNNMLVFHDLDKVTSLFIHIFPPLLTFCERWSARVDSLEVAGPMSFNQAILTPLVFELLWQVFYSLKTDILDRHKIHGDKDMLTSSKWLSEIKPHPIYRFLRSKGINIHPSLLLPAVQFIYTIIMLFPAWLAYNYYWFHVIYLGFVFMCACWRGACFYFDIFSENYSKRLQKSLGVDKDEKVIDNKYHPTSWMSVASFITFFILFLSAFLFLLTYLC